MSAENFISEKLAFKNKQYRQFVRSMKVLKKCSQKCVVRNFLKKKALDSPNDQRTINTVSIKYTVTSRTKIKWKLKERIYNVMAIWTVNAVLAQL